MDRHSRARKPAGEGHRRRHRPAPTVKGWRRYLRTRRPQRDRPGKFTRNLDHLDLRDVDTSVKVERTCLNKRWFSTASQAIEAALRESWWLGKPMAYYSCPVCPGYHLTSQVSKESHHPARTPPRRTRKATERRSGHRPRRGDSSPRAQPTIPHVRRGRPDRRYDESSQDQFKEKP